jgi:hypothetical protein
MGTLGGGYNEAVELLRRADRAQVLSTAVIQDAIPAELNIRQLHQFAHRDPALAKANGEVAKVGVVRPDLDATGFNLPATDSDPATRYTPPPPRPPLNREPGRIFGPKRHDVPAIDPGVVPAGGQ